MKVLFATTNPAKVKSYKEALEEKGIELLTIKDLGQELEIDESGKDAIENAHIKAKAYYDKFHIPTIGMDNNLFIEGIDEKKQPGTHVRRVNGKTLSDDEMIEYYTNLVKENGEKLSAKWVYGMTVCSNKGENSYSWNKGDFYFVSTVANSRNEGYPLDSISIVPKYNKYLVDLTNEEKIESKKENNMDNVIDFIVNSVNE